MGERATEKSLAVAGPAHRGRPRAYHDVVLRVLDGVVVLVTDDDELVLTPHDVATIPAGTRHRYWNGGDEEARVVETAVWTWRSTPGLVTVRHRPPQPAATAVSESARPATGLVPSRARARTPPA